MGVTPSREQLCKLIEAATQGDRLDLKRGMKDVLCEAMGINRGDTASVAKHMPASRQGATPRVESRLLATSTATEGLAQISDERYRAKTIPKLAANGKQLGKVLRKYMVSAWKSLKPATQPNGLSSRLPEREADLVRRNRLMLEHVMVFISQNQR